MLKKIHLFMLGHSAILTFTTFDFNNIIVNVKKNAVKVLPIVSSNVIVS